MEKISETSHQMKQQYLNDYLYKFKIQHLVKFVQEEVQSGTSILTLCLPPTNGQIQKALELTQAKNVNSKNIKNKKNKESVQDITQKLIKYLQGVNNKQFIQTHGIILYVGVFGKSGSVQLVEIQPIVKIQSFLYSCEFTANTQFLDDMIKPKTNNLFAIVDGLGVKIFTELMGKIGKDYDQDYQVIRQHHKGGQSANRFQHITQDNRHQQVKNSSENIIKIIRQKKVTFDSVYICGAETFKKEIIQNIKDSDVSQQIHKYYDISLPHSCEKFETLSELKQSIADIDEFAIQDEITKEKRIFQQFQDCMRESNDLCQFGFKNIFPNICSSNIQVVYINDDYGEQITPQQLQDFGFNPHSIFKERESLTIIEVLLEMKIQKLFNFELYIFQSSHMKYELGLFGGIAAIQYNVDDY